MIYLLETDRCMQFCAGDDISSFPFEATEYFDMIREWFHDHHRSMQEEFNRLSRCEKEMFIKVKMLEAVSDVFGHNII